MIQLELSLEEVNLILESLGQQPYVKVYQLVQKIHQQAQAQIGGVTDVKTPPGES
jgi:hypothetical protein